jgi:hypothetical protein
MLSNIINDVIKNTSFLFATFNYIIIYRIILIYKKSITFGLNFVTNNESFSK